MVDQFHEVIVYKKNRMGLIVTYSLITMLMYFFGVFGIIGITYWTMGVFELYSTIITAFCIIAVVAILLGRKRIVKDYEYAFTSGEMDFAEVYNNTKRKQLFTVQAANFQRFAPVSDPSYAKAAAQKGLVRLNYYLNKKNKLYFATFSFDQKPHLLVFEPDEEMVELIASCNPAAVR